MERAPLSPALRSRAIYLTPHSQTRWISSSVHWFTVSGNTKLVLCFLSIIYRLHCHYQQYIQGLCYISISVQGFLLGTSLVPVSLTEMVVVRMACWRYAHRPLRWVKHLICARLSTGTNLIWSSWNFLRGRHYSPCCKQRSWCGELRKLIYGKRQ